MFIHKTGWYTLSSIILLICWAIGSLLLLKDDARLDRTPAKIVQQPIKVVVRTGAESEAIRRIIAPFESETGMKVELIELGRNGYFTTIGTHLFAGTTAFDIVFMPSTYVAQFSSAQVIEPLDKYIQNPKLTDPRIFDMDDFLTTYTYQNHIYALPTDISTHLLYYRSDLIPNPPQTWEEVETIAKTFTKEITPSSPTRWGIGTTGLAPEELPKIFDSVAWTFKGQLMDTNGQVFLDSKESIQAGELLARFVREKLFPPDLLSWGFAETRDALLRGDIAMAVPYWNAAYSTILTSNSPMKNRIKVAMLPGIREQDGSIYRVPFQHGWALAINANSRNQAAAWKFLTYATGKRGGMIYAHSGGTPARKSILSDPLLRVIRPEFPLVLESMTVARNEPAVPFYPLLIDIQIDALQRILTLRDSPEHALEEAAGKLRTLEIHDQLKQ